MAELARTILYDRHLALGAKMVEFGGWEMPVQYPGGIVDEHLQTRKAAGLFDVSHMGRFTFRGRRALAFLQHALTNNAAALDVGQAQYTMIPNAAGGAVDDAYLYRFVEDEYLLVVNAANRAMDWEHFQALLKGFGDVQLADLSAELAMISLQGPLSRQIILDVTGLHELPMPPRRNALGIVTIAGTTVRVGRTGYTGEPLCFELFAPSEKAGELWDLLIARGAKPVGLGARDTLRLEAGLPLYGHELGTDPEGKEIPIFACPLAKFAVSFSPLKGEFVGRPALARQFEAFKRFAFGDYSLIADLPRIIVPLALIDRTVARGGAPVLRGETRVGFVTSGTMVPLWEVEGEGLASRFTEKSGLRAVCLALLDSNIRHGDLLEVEVRGRRFKAQVVRYHLRSEAPPYARPVTVRPEGTTSGPGGATDGSRRRKPPVGGPISGQSPEGAKERSVAPSGLREDRAPSPGADAPGYRLEAPSGPKAGPYGPTTNEASEPKDRLTAGLRTGAPSGLSKAKALLDAAAANTVWRQRECINLIPSEQTASPMARLLSVMDPAFRYAEHKAVKAFSDADVFYYQGTEFIAEVEKMLAAEFRQYLHCRQVETRVISGQMANTAVFSAVVDYLNRANRQCEPRRIRCVMNNDIFRGGHLSAQPMGALKDFVARDERTAGAAVVNFPVEAGNPYRIDVAAAGALIEQHRPELIILGKSLVLHPEPVREIRRVVDRLGLQTVIMYDMAHVLGLAGPHFQEPFADGADLVTGSTHKTFFGTQRGVVAGNLDDSDVRHELWDAIERRTFPGSVSNHHLGTMVGLLMAAYEMNAFKDEYQKAVLANAKALAASLKHCGMDVAGDPAVGYTQTHQVIVNVGYGHGPEAARRLEDNNIIVNYQAGPYTEGFSAAEALRLGVQEMTRFDMGAAEMRTIAELIGDVVIGGRSVADKVKSLRRPFTELKYCFKGAEVEEAVAKLRALL